MECNLRLFKVSLKIAHIVRVFAVLGQNCRNKKSLVSTSSHKEMLLENSEEDIK